MIMYIKTGITPNHKKSPYFCVMKIDVIPYASAIRPDLVVGRHVVVIDVLRASSVMVTALAHGARAFIPVRSVEEARQKAAAYSKGEVLLCGERNTRVINGFHLGNSPLDYTREKVAGKTLILTTSNGTQALNRLQTAARVFIGSFLNMEALLQYFIPMEEVVLVCSGTNNNFSMDDAMCAALFIDEMGKKKPVELSDLAITLHKAYQKDHGDLKTLLRDCYHLNLLKRNGFGRDVDYCLQKNILDVVPEMKEGVIRPIDLKSKE
ncbi:MAG TPA: 2-phosphosulfolactate phosphatase [Bacteroidetes bacterium]|nr:2-phosphosulfolactate phosphatase [Bacteroidota bacterium]